MCAIIISEAGTIVNLLDCTSLGSPALRVLGKSEQSADVPPDLTSAKIKNLFLRTVCTIIIINFILCAIEVIIINATDTQNALTDEDLFNSPRMN